MSDWIDLGNPLPRNIPKHYEPIVWPKGKAIDLFCHLSRCQPKNFEEVILNRSTKRTFFPLSIVQLANLLWLSNIVKSTAESKYGFVLSNRPTPSAGSIHPIHILIAFPGEISWYRLDPFQFTLNEVKAIHSTLEFRYAMNEVLNTQQSTILLLAAEIGKTAAKYEYSNSLVWREAGVMLGSLGVIAEFLGLHYCPLGVTGEPWASQLVNGDFLRGVGVALVGSSE